MFTHFPLLYHEKEEHCRDLFFIHGLNCFLPSSAVPQPQILLTSHFSLASCLRSIILHTFSTFSAVPKSSQIFSSPCYCHNERMNEIWIFVSPYCETVARSSLKTKKQ